MARHGLEDLDRFAVLFDQVAYKDDAIEASVGTSLAGRDFGSTLPYSIGVHS